ncbi:IPT/TIG domain-containing protein [Micromonospora foliorum]|uniref:IPT/TIG domain-containing protein n=1 Tax=Micromonospora foliorum TaxID=2911210 RepID=UPI001EE7F5F2|nr:IPT/TIG domain-containing protein [Micromonospora foliorum]MCG5437515.1 IPT/TIG domain-containing protein [Micromonospora foliorum]
MALAIGCGTVVGANATPAAADAGGPTALTTAGQACATQAPGPYLSPDLLNDARAVVLQGSLTDAPQSAEPQADFQVWDVTRPDEPQQWRDGVDQRNNRVYIQLEDPARQLDGVTYAWRVRVLDGAVTSPWSDTCYFTLDRTGGPAPAVVSTTYPSGSWDNAGGAVGAAGDFSFTSASDDTVSYRYRFSSGETGGDDDYSTVPATGLGGPATVTWTPKGASHHSVSVYAVDRAGNWSDQTFYEFWVRETRPSVFSAAYPEWSTNLDYGVGVPGAFEFTSNVPGTEAFAWRIDGDGPSGSVAADADGKAAPMIAPTRAGRQTMYVRSVTSDGATHPERAYTFVVDNAPRVTGDVNRGVIIGSSLRFHLAPRMPDVESYLYWRRDHNGTEPDQKTVLPAGADGTADLTWTATNDNMDTQALLVQSRSADGTLSEPRFLPISVWDASPYVTRSGGDVLGSTATFTARTEMENVADYEILLNRDPATRQVVPAAADGTVTFRYTLTKRGYTYVTVVARNAAGVRTGEGGTSWSVTDSPVVVSTDFPSSGSGRIAPGTFTFKPRQPGAVKYAYQTAGAEGTVAAAADGTATITWTPPDSGNHTLYVKSLTADGVESMQTYYSFYVAPDPLTVTSVSPASVAAGGVRTITVTGSGFHQEDRVTVTPTGGAALTATVQSVSADHRTLTAEVDLTSAAAGKASVSVRPDDWSDAVSLADAFSITAAQIQSVTAPTITGTVAVGATVSASTGQWNPAATAYTYQWAADGTAISGATGSTYVIPASRLGKRLTVTVTATRPGYSSAQATSTATVPVATGAAPQATVKPTITGTARVGQTVQATTGTWTPTADSYRYEWRVGGLRTGITTNTLTLTAGMRDKAVTVIVTAVKAGHADGRATSAPVTVRA